MEDLENELSRLEIDLEAFTAAITRLVEGGASSTPSLAATSSAGDNKATTLRTTTAASSSFRHQQHQESGTLSHTAQLWSVVVLAAVVVLLFILAQWFTRLRKVRRGCHKLRRDGTVSLFLFFVLIPSTWF